jgi:hypothetical protein
MSEAPPTLDQFMVQLHNMWSDNNDALCFSYQLILDLWTKNVVPRRSLCAQSI